MDSSFKTLVISAERIAQLIDQAREKTETLDYVSAQIMLGVAKHLTEILQLELSDLKAKVEHYSKIEQSLNEVLLGHSYGGDD